MLTLCFDFQCRAQFSARPKTNHKQNHLNHPNICEIGKNSQKLFLKTVLFYQQTQSLKIAKENECVNGTNKRDALQISKLYGKQNSVENYSCFC